MPTHTDAHCSELNRHSQKERHRLLATDVSTNDRYVWYRAADEVSDNAAAATLHSTMNDQGNREEVGGDSPPSERGNAGEEQGAVARVSAHDELSDPADRDAAVKAGTKGTKKTPRKRRRISKKPDDMPRRPLSAYNIYFRDQRRQMVDAERERLEREGRERLGDAYVPPVEDPKIGFEHMAKTIAKSWKQLAPEELEVYKALAKQDTERYNRETEEYQKELARRSREERERMARERASSVPTSVSMPSQAMTEHAWTHQPVQQNLAARAANQLGASTQAPQGSTDQLLKQLIAQAAAPVQQFELWQQLAQLSSAHAAPPPAPTVASLTQADWGSDPAMLVQLLGLGQLGGPPSTAPAFSSELNPVPMAPAIHSLAEESSPPGPPQPPILQQQQQQQPFSQDLAAELAMLEAQLRRLHESASQGASFNQQQQGNGQSGPGPTGGPT